ncbi:hypothetical protein [Paenibacillus sp. SI8]|uniref:hypothetical protein n=1 Tax=unclassified Paenibacillus TaxID=185978 RepID=UPI003467D01D
MLYVLKHNSTSQIFTSTLVNQYGLAYYGVKFWHDRSDAEAEMEQVLQQAGMLAPAEIEWNILELEEGEMKLCNVRLRNDPASLLFWREDRKPEIRHRENA